MGENLLFSLNSTMPMFFLILFGYILKRINFLDNNFIATANKFVFHVTLPVMLFLDLAGTDLRASFDGRYILFCAGVTTASILVIWVLARLLLRDKSLVGEFVQACYRSSAAILGAAFIQNIYGSSEMSGLMILGSVPLYNIFAVLILTLESPAAEGQKDTAASPASVRVFFSILLPLCNIRLSLFSSTPGCFLTKTAQFFHIMPYFRVQCTCY